MNGLTVTGQLTGSAREIEDTMEFAVANEVRPMIERLPLGEANEAVAGCVPGRPLPHRSGHRLRAVSTHIAIGAVDRANDAEGC